MKGVRLQQGSIDHKEQTMDPTVARETNRQDDGILE